MNELDVRIVTLESIHVASFLGFGENPEELAWGKLTPWAKEKGLLEDSENTGCLVLIIQTLHQQPNYGYECGSC